MSIDRKGARTFPSSVARKHDSSFSSFSHRSVDDFVERSRVGGGGDRVFVGVFCVFVG